MHVSNLKQNLLQFSFPDPSVLTIIIAITVCYNIGIEIVLANTYHLHIRPGDKVIRELGGLHRFMGWNGPLLSDSGGYQVFSLAKRVTVCDEGVTFQSHVDGSEIHLTPEKVVQIQENLGVDIMMVLDECPPYPLERDKVERSLERTIE